MAGRSSIALEPEQFESLKELFNNLDDDCNGELDIEELGAALEVCNIKMAGHELRNLIPDLKVKFDEDKNGTISYKEFEKLYKQVRSEKDLGIRFKKQVTTRQNVQTLGGYQEGTQHSVKCEETLGFAKWINSQLGDDEDCKDLLPINPETDDLYKSCKGGILLCKLINKAMPGTIDDRTINKEKLNVYRRVENHNLVLNSARSIGCNVVNIGHNDLEACTPHLVLGLVWQIIRIGLLSEVDLTKHPGLVLLLNEDETIEDLLKLSPEEILIRWVNYHLRNSESDLQISNFSKDIMDSEAYTFLLQQIAPRDKGVNVKAMGDPDMLSRAERMLGEAEKIECRAFITAKDVVKGNAKLNLAFVANLFNEYPALEKPADMDVEIIEETREEKTYRNWMNSMGVNPFVNRLYNDLTDGQILFQLYDVIKPKVVNWDKVNTRFTKLKMKFQKIENCNYAVDLGKELKFSLVGICGNDIHDGHPTLTLALVWQLMRAYTLSMLRKVSGDGKPVEDKHILSWANEKLKEGGSDCRVASFQDPTLSNSITILNLIESIQPKKVNWKVVKDSGSEEDNLSNAKYAISMGRKIGARIYALPEDIVEVKPKMIMTIFACLMICGLRDNEQVQSAE